MSGILSSLKSLATGGNGSRGEDTAMRFSIGPSPGESGYNQWVDAMKMVARLPGGIPPEFRKRLWLTLAERHLQNKGVNWAQAERACFNEWSNPDDNELGVQIVKDLHRTGCSLFCGSAGQENQALLKRVLLAYARWNKAVGYCQGFNMLAALILQVMDRSETDSVKVMIYLIEGVLPESYFANNLRGLSVDMAVFRDLLRLRLPTLSRHLDTLQNDAHEGTSYEPPLTNVFTMQWFLTLFCNCLPQETVLRVWDLIFLEGNEILLRTALAIWDRLSDRILAVNSADEFYSIMGVLTREMLEYGAVDANTLIKAVVSIEVRSELSDLRDKYLYNITPWTQTVQSAAKKGWRLFYSDDDELESDTDEKMAVATAYGISINKRKESLRRQSSPSTIQPYAYGHPDREKLALDISALKQQYAKLKERQRQAHIILTAACARQPMPHSPNSAPMTMNHLLLGKSALIVRGRRLGPPQGAVPPSRHIASKSSRSSTRPPKGGETLHWKDTNRKRSLTFSRPSTLPESPSENGDKDGTTKDISDSAKDVSGDGECAASGGGGGGNSSSSYSDSDSSSTSTELCDEPDRLSDFDGEDVISPREETIVNEPKQSDNVPDIDGTSIELKDSDTKVEAASASDIEDVSLNLTLRLDEELPQNLSYSPVDSINSTKAIDADSENLSNIETQEIDSTHKSDWEQNVWDTSPEYSQAELSFPSPKKSLYEELEEIMALNKKADENNENCELDSPVEIPVDEEFKEETDTQLNDLDNFKLVDESEKTSEVLDTDDYTRQSLLDIDNSSLSPLYSYDISDTVSKDYGEIDTVKIEIHSNENVALETYSKPFDFEKFLEERVKFLKQNSVESLSSTKACFDSTEHRTPSIEEKTIEELEEKSFSEEQFPHSEENFDKLSIKQDSLDEISKNSSGTPSFKISSEFSFDEIQEKLYENLSETGSNECVTSVDNLEPTKCSLEKQISLDSMRLPQLEHDAGRRHSERALRIIQENSAILHRILQFQSKSVEIVEEETKETDVEESSIFANSIAENSSLFANSVVEDSSLFANSVEEDTSLFAKSVVEDSLVFANSVVEDSSLFANSVEDSSLFANSLVEDSSLFANSVVEDSSLLANSVLEDSSLFANSAVTDSSLITVANNCNQSLIESPEKDTDDVKNTELSEVISTEDSQKNVDASFESVDFESNRNTTTLEDSPDSVNEKYRFTFRIWENRMEELSKQAIKLETIDIDLPRSQEHSKPELKDSPDETNYVIKSIYSSDLNTDDKLYSLSPEQKSEKNIDDSATALYNYKSELSFDVFSNKPVADIDWKESYQKHTDHEELYSSSEKETFSGTSSGYKTDINLSEDDNNVRCGSVSGSTTLSYSTHSILPSKSTPYFDISVTPTTDPSRSQFISSTSPSKTFSTAISPTYTSLKMSSSPIKDQIESPPYSYSKYRLSSPFDKSPGTAQESSTYRSNKFGKSSFIDDSPESDPFKSTVSSYQATESDKYILSSPSKIRSYAKSPTKIKESLASSKYSYAHSDVYRSSSESPIRTKISVETHSKPYRDLDSISRTKSSPESEFCLDLPSQSSFKADLLRYSIKSPVKSPISYSEFSSKCYDKDKLSLEFLDKTDNSKNDTKRDNSLVSPPYSYTQKQPISNFTQESYSYTQNQSKPSPDSLKSPENSTSKTQFRHLQFSPLSPTRKKSLSPISPQTFNPFPIRPATRQPKDVGLKLGIYKDISPLKSPSK